MTNDVGGNKIFVTHGSNDLWVAGQIAKELRGIGAAPFLDAIDIPKGTPNFPERIRKEISTSIELLALITPWSAVRSWVWVEIGAAWSLGLPVVALFYGMTVDDLETTGQGKAVLAKSNVMDLNSFPTYLIELAVRIKERQ